MQGLFRFLLGGVGGISFGLSGIVGVFLLAIVGRTTSRNNIYNDKVDHGEGQSDNSEADSGVDDGFFGFFEFAGVASGGHVINAADENENDRDNAADGNDGVQDAGNEAREGVTITVASSGFFDFAGGATRTDVVLCVGWECCGKGIKSQSADSDYEDGFKDF